MATGSGSVSADDLTLVFSGLTENRAMIVCTSIGRGRTPLGNGILCLSNGSNIQRFPVGVSDSTGNAQLGPDLVSYTQLNFAPGLGIEAGSTRHFQAWFRDPHGPCGNGTNLTHGLTVAFGL